MSLSKKNQSGFTLIEVIIAMLIVSVGLLAMGSLLITSIRVNHGSEQRLDAGTVAQSVLTHVVSKARTTVGYTEAAAQQEAENLLGTRLQVQVPGVKGKGYNPTVTLSTTPTVANGYTNITVQLDWYTYGVMKSVMLRSGAYAE